VQRILREHGIHFVQDVWQEGAEQPLETADDGAEEAAAEAEDIENAAPPRAPGAGERREPTFSRPPVQAPAAASRPTVAESERDALAAALAELTECRRLLAAALEET
jgi:hypothetical protein